MSTYDIYDLLEPRPSGSDEREKRASSSVASLLNLGNTCFLNSVLYTLRFTPSFLHKLHHLNTLRKTNGNNCRDSDSNNNRNLSECEFESSTDPSDMIIGELHELYATLRYKELNYNTKEPHRADHFLRVLRLVNPIFEGNEQHDAQELLVCLLDVIREAGELAYRDEITADEILFNSLSSNHLETRAIDSNLNPLTDLDIDDLSRTNECYSKRQVSIFEDFRGVSLLQTMCLECENVTERRETFCDISLPIWTLRPSDRDNETMINDLYKSIIVTEEYFLGKNKYWCEECRRYNEARRCVKYEKSPKLLILHLKRFASNFGTLMIKLNDYMPTPFKLPCFCQDCNRLELPEERPHQYTLYAIIMHLGATIASGHYIAYVKRLDSGRERSNHMQENMSSMRGANSGSEPDSTSRRSSTCNLKCCTIQLQKHTTANHGHTDDAWLKCDDETVSVLSTQDFVNMLSPKRLGRGDTGTPYLLFYSKVDLTGGGDQ